MLARLIKMAILAIFGLYVLFYNYCSIDFFIGDSSYLVGSFIRHDISNYLRRIRALRKKNNELHDTVECSISEIVKLERKIDGLTKLNDDLMAYDTKWTKYWMELVNVARTQAKLATIDSELNQKLLDEMTLELVDWIYLKK